MRLDITNPLHVPSLVKESAISVMMNGTPGANRNSGKGKKNITLLKDKLGASNTSLRLDVVAQAMMILS